MKYALVLLLLVILAGLAYIRLSPIPADWHVDPAEATRTGKPNDYLVGPGGDVEAPRFSEAPAALMARFDQIAMAQPRVTRLAGGVDDAHVTYVQRSRLMGYPDTISVRAVPDGDGAHLMIWSRSRFGHSDLGVNKARIESWLSQLSDGG